ncbi:hypothetical protein [Methylomonas koyamae]|uniref:hypothetical protein n=1 Tax=Methylomonas koyamae TaxID=702114 RepID=UPI002872F15A|nr:hypothetical protein [Methylomonas koyamae]WNB74358.1 hypothetical protein RI210_13835 [Methylomonas koyamae]
MSLAQKSFKAAVVAPLILAAFSTCANADSRTVELSDLDLSKALPSNICFVDNEKGTAISKLMTALGARNQKSVIIADQYTPTGHTGDIYI